MLLIIACVNVASLFLARGAARETELAVRAALGCSGWRLVRQLLVESLVLSLAGGVAGLLLAKAITGTLLAAAPEAVARAGSGALERSVFAFSFGAAVLAGIGFGVAPALQATRPDLEAVLRESGRSGSGAVVKHAPAVLGRLSGCAGAGSARRRRIVVEKLRASALGRSRRAGITRLTFEVHLPRDTATPNGARGSTGTSSRLAALPGVRAAAAISRLPTGTYPAGA